MAKMFRKADDLNGVEYSTNSHPASEYTQAESDQKPARPHYMAGQEGRGGYMEPAAEDMVHKAKDRVIGGVDGRPGAMSFSGDLLPRADRIGERMHEKHAAECWCDKCRPQTQDNALPTRY